MRLPPFALHRPETLDEASALLGELGDEAAIFCGGTELLLVTKLGLADHSALIDVKRIEELRGIAANGELRIGAAVPHRAIERSPAVARALPALAAMERGVGNLRVRTSGTIGGNLCFADPHSDPATFLLAAGGSVLCRAAGAPERRIAIADFVRGPYETALAPGELLTAVQLPVPEPGSAIAHRKLSFHERPAITVAARLTLRAGAIADARLAIGSIGLVPLLAVEAGAALDGRAVDAVDDDALAGAGELAAEACDPIEDANGSIDYKRQLVRVLSRRVLREALDALR